MYQAVFSLGSNLGKRKKNIFRMQREVSGLLTAPLLLSPLMETEPVGTCPGQRWFLNRIISGGYSGSAFKLIRVCQQIEKKMGRKNKGDMAPRVADIDILLCGSLRINKSGFILPHPELTKRRFCVEGINSILPEMVHPETGRSFRDYYMSMNDVLKNQKILILSQ